MNLPRVASVYAVIFVAELPDELIEAVRHDSLPYWFLALEAVSRPSRSIAR
jgi:hypothetical protein